MSLNRYINQEQIIQQNEPHYGQLFFSEDLRILPFHQLIPTAPISETISQIHIYSLHGDYLAGDHDASLIEYEPITKSYLLDVAASFREANIYRGSYKIAVNLFKSVWGTPENSVVVLNEISPDRTEIKLRIPPILVRSESHGAFTEKVLELNSDNILNNLVVDFGYNRVAKIVLIKFDTNEPDVIYLKLYGPLDEQINEKDSGWFAFEIADPYIDTVLLAAPISAGAVNVLRKPNFDIDTTQYNSNATVFKSWDDLLDTDAETAQRIIESSLSGSASVPLNIDYTSFDNFIFYSSAEERLENFKYKLGLIQTYNDSISTLQNSTASNTSFVSSSVATYRRRVDILTSTLDHFEKWLYYSPTASIFSHDKTGSLTPWPKYLSDGKYVLHHTTSSIATTWYASNLVSASAYDKTNYNRLWWSIPEHLLMDDGNSNYVTFVEMVGNHFDNLYAYVHHLTKIHERDEHNERGVSNNLLFHIAKSFGWNLQNTRQLSDLWFYKLGTDSTGRYESTGSMFSLSRETQSQIIWRRIVNNLPYLLKTKGTSRSVKALMSIYGIPQTLISIKEYGGPSLETDKPQWIEDRFSYALSLRGRQNVQLYRYRIDSPSGSWHSDGITRHVPDTVMFRFGTNYSGSTSMSLFAMENVTGPARNVAEVRLHHARELTGTSSYSGSYTYGRVSFTIETSNPSFQYFSGSTDYLPLFDGDMWTVRLHTQTPVTPTSNTASFYLDVARAADCTYGEYIISSSVTVTAYSNSGSNNFYAWGVSATQSAQPNLIKLGGTTASFGISSVIGTASFFSGSMQGYKEYFRTMSRQTFNEHVLNPAAYHLNEPTTSFYALYRYFPLGLDVIRHDHVISQSVMSSHPNRAINYYLSASFNNFSGSQSQHYDHVNETYYIYSPSIGGYNVRSNKLRIESNQLTSDLSPLRRAERSLYDRAPVDTGRLAIVFSQADQVNRDIFNQFGFDELDNYIGGPDLEFEDNYQDLKNFADEYWKKYQQANDINAFIRILSVYDYTFFEQIRQLSPGRADLIAGILVEQNVLERPKLRVTKRPTLENPSYEQTITKTDAQSGEIPTYETSASVAAEIDFVNCYYTSSIDYDRDVYIENCYYTASIEDPVEISGSMCHHFETSHQNTGLCGVVDVYRNRYSGSQCVTGSQVEQPRIHTTCKYHKVVYHYSASGTFPTKYLKQWYTAVSMSYKMHYSRSLTPTGYQIDECSTRNNSRFRGSKLTGAGINIDSPDTIDGGPVISVIEIDPNTVFSGTEYGAGDLQVQ